MDMEEKDFENQYIEKNGNIWSSKEDYEEVMGLNDSTVEAVNDGNNRFAKEGTDIMYGDSSYTDENGDIWSSKEDYEEAMDLSNSTSKTR